MGLETMSRGWLLQLARRAIEKGYRSCFVQEEGFHLASGWSVGLDKIGGNQKEKRSWQSKGKGFKCGLCWLKEGEVSKEQGKEGFGSLSFPFVLFFVFF